MEQRLLTREGGRIQPRRGFHAIDRVLPKSSRELALLSRHIADTLSSGDQALVMICEWGVWPSEEFSALFTRAMAGYGDARTLVEAPGFLFSQEETDDLRDIIRVGIISGWDAAMLHSSGEVGFFVSHDEWYNMFGSSPEALQDWARDRFDEVLWSGFVT